jgi:hypothetical protein
MARQGNETLIESEGVSEADYRRAMTTGVANDEVTMTKYRRRG